MKNYSVSMKNVSHLTYTKYILYLYQFDFFFFKKKEEN